EVIVGGQDGLAKVQTVINVKAFGAKGDDSTDDAPAITRAIRHAESLNRKAVGVYFPPGKYRLHTSLPVPDYLTFYGDGWGVSVLRPVGQASGFYEQSTTHDVVFRDFEIDGSLQGTSDGSY